MNILLINGSMRGQHSASLKVAEAFVKGITEVDQEAKVTRVDLRDMRIEHCYGCFCCWKISKGECVIHDDMDELRRLVMENDIIIESFPLYFFGLPSKLKAFTDRMISYVSEYRAVNGDEATGRFLHEMRFPELMKKKLVLVSTCGYEETVDCYDAVRLEFDRICGPGNYTTVFVPQGGMMSEDSFENKIQRNLLKITDAGKEFAVNGKLSEETVKKVETPMLGHNTFSQAINMNWDVPGVGPYGKIVK